MSCMVLNSKNTLCADPNIITDTPKLFNLSHRRVNLLSTLHFSSMCLRTQRMVDGSPRRRMRRRPALEAAQAVQVQRGGVIPTRFAKVSILDTPRSSGWTNWRNCDDDADAAHVDSACIGVAATAGGGPPFAAPETSSPLHSTTRKLTRPCTKVVAAHLRPSCDSTALTLQTTFP